MAKILSQKISMIETYFFKLFYNLSVAQVKVLVYDVVILIDFDKTSIISE